MFGGSSNKKKNTQGGDDGTASARMEEGRSSSRKRKQQRQDNIDIIPARRVLHKVFIGISLLTALCAVWMLAGQIMGIFVYQNTVVTYVLRGYVVLLCVLVVLIEMEWPAAVRDTFMFKHWFCRGLFYGFIGVVGMQENGSSEVAVKDEKSESYAVMAEIITGVAWAMVGCGILYCLMAVFCLHYLLKSLRQDYQDRLAAAKEGQHSHSENKPPSGGTSSIVQEEGVEVEAGAELAAVLDAESVFAADQKVSELDWAKEEEAPEGKTGELDEDHRPSWAVGEPDDDKTEPPPKTNDDWSREEEDGGGDGTPTKSPTTATTSSDPSVEAARNSPSEQEVKSDKEEGSASADKDNKEQQQKLAISTE